METFPPSETWPTLSGLLKQTNWSNVPLSVSPTFAFFFSPGFPGHKAQGLRIGD